jgi:hypothetical protein
MGCGGSKPATTGAAGGGTAAGAASKSAAKGGEKKKSFDADYKRGSTVSLCHADVSYLSLVLFSAWPLLQYLGGSLALFCSYCNVSLIRCV